MHVMQTNSVGYVLIATTVAIYGSDVQFTDTEKSRVFVKVTKTKTLAAYGQIVDVLFGNNKFPLSVNPSVCLMV
jgi:hypothetical protein